MSLKYEFPTGYFTMNDRVEEILKNDKGKEVLDVYFKNFYPHPRFQLLKRMPLGTVCKISSLIPEDERLKISEKINKIKKINDGILQIKVLSKDNEELAHSEGEMAISLTYESEYVSGDRIEITVDRAKFVEIKIDDYVQSTIVFVPKGKFVFTIPFDENRWAYHFCAFEGEKHQISVKNIDVSILKSRRNLALNSLDQREPQNTYPHAWTNFVTHDAGYFEAKNAIDGIVINDGHGPYPFQSWGSDKRDDIEFKLEFGRRVAVDEVVLYLRFDDIDNHDVNWETGVLEFSDGGTLEISMAYTPKGQSYRFEEKTIEWVKLHSLKKVSDEFAALSQIEVYGYETDESI